MPKAEPGVAPLMKGAGDRFSDKVAPIVVAGAIMREEKIRNDFVPRWGELLSHGPEGLGPTTLSGVIEAKQRALAQLRAGLEGRPASDVPMLSTYAQLERSAVLAARGLGPEGELKRAFKVMKAGI
jgi:hypothetical protein